MGINVTWDNDAHTVLLYSFQDPWNWDDYAEANALSRTMLDSVDYKVVTIIDFSQTKSLPRGAIKRMGTSTEQLHPQQGSFIIVAASPFIQTIIGILTHLYPQKMRDTYHVKTLDQARTLPTRKSWMQTILRHISS